MPSLQSFVVLVISIISVSLILAAHGQEQLVSFSVSYGNGTTDNYDAPYVPDENVFQSMRLLEKIDPSFTFTYENFSFGHFVTSINGVQGEWLYFCGNQILDCGIDEVYLFPGSEFEWILYQNQSRSTRSSRSCPQKCLPLNR